MIIFFTHIKFSRTLGPARNTRKYVLCENLYDHSIHFSLIYMLYLQNVLVIHLNKCVFYIIYIYIKIAFAWLL